MRAQCDRRKLFWKAFSTLPAQFVRFMVPGIALLAVVVILFMMFWTMHAPVTHVTTSVAPQIAGEGPGNGPVAFPAPIS